MSLFTFVVTLVLPVGMHCDQKIRGFMNYQT